MAVHQQKGSVIAPSQQPWRQVAIAASQKIKPSSGLPDAWQISQSHWAARIFQDTSRSCRRELRLFSRVQRHV